MLATLLRKYLKGFAYASATGAITLGAAEIDLVNADFTTITYVVIVSVSFNIIKEAIKSWWIKTSTITEI